MNDSNLYRMMYLIRKFEERALTEFSSGNLVGTTHAYIGQEANAAGLLHHLVDGDIVWSNHRCHGHFLAYGGDATQLAAELMGKETGVVAGRGGSQHIHWKNFYSNGIQGGIVPVATGMAFAQKLDDTGKIAVVFIGDGTLGEGALYETLNLASLWSIPVLIVVEENGYAQTTPVEQGVSGSIVGRFEAFGIKTYELASSDVVEVSALAHKAINHVRGKTAPAALILHTHRFSAHSKGDDTRDKEEVKKLRETSDPLELHRSRIQVDERKVIEAEVMFLVDDAFKSAYDAPYPILREELK
jgi:TPP-dependent pyruvate/acetoin dehydrogenase alpha subunit